MSEALQAYVIELLIAAGHVTTEQVEQARAIAAQHHPLQQAQAPGWLDIATAPKDGSMFLCWVSAVRYGETDEGQQYQQDASQVDFCWWRDVYPDIPGGGYFDPACGQIADSQDVTHWMPLPPAPQQGAKT